LIFIPDIFEFEFLRAFACVVRRSHLLDEYLVMFEERKPIGGLFRNIEECLRAIRDLLPLCWEPPGCQRVDRRQDVEPTHINSDPSCS
jgi:hypothetical protein